MDDCIFYIIQRNLLHKLLWNTTARYAHRVWRGRERKFIIIIIVIMFMKG